MGTKPSRIAWMMGPCAIYGEDSRNGPEKMHAHALIVAVF